MIRKKKEKAFAIYLKIYTPSIYKQCYTDYLYKGSPTSTVSTSTISTSTNFIAIGIKLVLVEFLTDCYVVKLVLVEIDYVVTTSTNFT